MHHGKMKSFGHTDDLQIVYLMTIGRVMEIQEILWITHFNSFNGFTEIVDDGGIGNRRKNTINQ